MKVLPKKIFREDVAKQHSEKLEEEQERFQKSVADLSEAMNMTFPDVAALEAINEEWLKDQISKSKKSLKSIFGAGGGFIPAGISKQFEQNYTDIKNKALPLVNSIVWYMDDLKKKGIKVKVDSKGRPWLDEKDVKASVEAAATYTFSDAQREAWVSIVTACEALDEWRKYEKANNFTQSPILALLDNVAIANKQDGKTSFVPTPEQFFTWIAWGKVLRPCDYNAYKEYQEMIKD